MGRKRRAANQIKSIPEELKKNEKFEEYYRGQGLIPEAEWDAFMDSLRSDLIATFRVTGCREQSAALLRLIQRKFMHRLQSGTAAKPTPLAWYPGEMAWSLNAPRREIRRTEEMKKLHQFLVSETETGYISRQEAVSMIPPLLMDIRSHHAVLDLCAAPGSKAAQLVELLHSDGQLGRPGACALPSGLVVANDRDNDRCYMMIHQVKRLQSPCVVVTRHDATIFPRLHLEPDSAGGPRDLLFDRVLADVPCSGDGTLRKNPDLWARWNPGLGVAEHFVQARILRRGLELLKVGGRLVYSTCSLNPVEDEAVICSVLAQCPEAVQLVDVSGTLPGLRTSPGVRCWRVMTKEGEWVASADEVPTKHLRCLRPSLFPPAADAFCPPLERCMRILPHHQDTGGFFVAVLQKVANLPWMKAPAAAAAPATADTEDAEKEKEKADEPSKSPAGDTNGSCPPAKKPRKGKMVYKEDPFFYMSKDDPEWGKIRAYYGLAEDAWPQDQLLFRCAEGKRRNFYFTNRLLRSVVRANQDREGVVFINLGVKMFALCEDNDFGGYRLLQEGCDLLEKAVTRHRLVIRNRADLMTLLRYEIPLMYRFTADLLEQFKAQSVGPVLMEFGPAVGAVSEGGEGEEDSQEGDPGLPDIRLVFAGWRGKVSLRLYVNKHERAHLMRLCGVLSPLPSMEDRGLDGDSKAKEEEDEAKEQEVKEEAAEQKDVQ